MATDLRSRLERFFTEYGDALASFDAERSAALWGTPGTLVNDEFVGALGTREEMAAGLRQSYPVYRSLGLAGVRFELTEVDVRKLCELAERRGVSLG